MRYLNRIDIDTIIDRYDEIVAWGTGPIFRLNYKTNYYRIDYLIDGTGRSTGTRCKGFEVQSDKILDSETKKLIIIYAIYEKEILEQIEKYDRGNIDTIIYSLLDIKLYDGAYVPLINGKSSEDMILFSLINQLELDDISYLEIGVCHPIMRNNTYLLYEQFSEDRIKGKGVLVEANPICWSLIETYRPKDILIKAGINTTEDVKVLNFYMFPHLLGHSTFSKKLADSKKRDGYDYETLLVPVKTINKVIEDNFDVVPDLLALDAEGMDFDIICSLDFEKYPIKIIVTEIMDGIDEPIEHIMNERGYKQYARTVENIIWVKEKFDVFV